MDSIEVMGNETPEVSRRDQSVVEQLPTESTQPDQDAPSPTAVSTKMEKRESRLPVPGSRLPVRKSSNPSLVAEPLIQPKRTSKLALPVSKIQTTGLRRPSAGGISPSRSPGASPSLKPQSSTGSLRSPSTPTRIGAPRSPVGGGQRSVSVSVGPPKALPKPGSAPNGTITRRASGLPTITKTPSRDNFNLPPASSPVTSPTAKSIPLPKKHHTIPTRASSARQAVPPAATTSPDATPVRPTLNTRSLPRSASFQTSPTKPLMPRLAASAVVPPKPISATPKTPTGSLKISKPRSRPSILPVAEPEPEQEPVDKRQRALASSQALREQIAAARAAKKAAAAASGPETSTGRSGGGGGGAAANDWPEVVIAGIDDKKESDEEEKASGEEEEESEDEGHPFDTPEEKEERARAKAEKRAVKQKTKSLDIRPGGILDLTSKALDNFDEQVVGETNPALAKVLLLQRNSLPAFPLVLTDFSSLYTLDLSCNVIKGDDYLTQRMSFPYLKTLFMHTNQITSLNPIFELLDLPRINYLDVHANRLTSYPKGMTRTFKTLTDFIASDNQIEEIQLDGIEGLQVLDLMNNSIGHLPPILGTFEKLRELRVVGNVFRVPRRAILEKCTEELLEWLRDKIPAGEKQRAIAAPSATEDGSPTDKANGWDIVSRDEARVAGRPGTDDDVD